MSELLLSTSLSNSQSLVAPDHAPFTVPATSTDALTLTAVHAHRSERTYAAVHSSLARMVGDFSSRLHLPSATYLNIVHAEFLC